MPLGVALHGARVSGRTALKRAQSALAAHRATDSEQGSTAFEEPEPAESVSGLRVSRDVGAARWVQRPRAVRTRRGTSRRGNRWPIAFTVESSKSFASATDVLDNL